MKKVDLGQTIAILANAGVIAGIVFLAFELQQNNQLLGVQVRSVQFDQAIGFPNQILQNPSLAAALRKAEQNESITPDEEILLRALALRGLRQLEYSFQDARARGVPVSAAEIALYQSGFRGEGIFRWPLGNYWAGMKSFFDPDFVEFVEDSVVAE